MGFFISSHHQIIFAKEKGKKESPIISRRCYKPKGNGINDGLVRLVCVYAVVFWLPGFALAGLYSTVDAAANFADFFYSSSQCRFDAARDIFN